MKIFESFAGYGSQRMALRNIGVDFEVVGISEIDKYALQAYKAIHGDCPNFGDISKINWEEVPDFDLLTYSFPCQDISLAGKQKGLAKDSGTRSSLLWECEKAIKIKRPKYLLMENVKDLVNKKNLPYFLEWEKLLRGYGYVNFTQVSNAKHYGVPQNRNRVFTVSILDDGWFLFPQKIKLTNRLKDVLEENVDKKYYLSEKLLSGFLKHRDRHKEKGNGFGFSLVDTNKTARCISTQAGNRHCDNYVSDTTEILAEITPNSQAGKVYNVNGVAPTLCAGTHGYALGYINAPSVFQLGRGFNKGGHKELCPAITTNSFEQNNFVCEPIIVSSRGRNPDNPKSRIAGLPTKQMLEPNREGIANTITTVQKDNLLLEQLSIRKLTPLEVWRLMGTSDEDFYKAQNDGLSDTQLYKMAGNSIVVQVLEGIFRNMFKSAV